MQRKFLLPALALGAFLLVGGAAYVQAAQASAAHNQGLRSPGDQNPVDRAAKVGLGISVADLTQQLAQRLGITYQEGVVVIRVLPDGPAAKAGVQEKDIITTVNGTSMKTLKDLMPALKDLQAGAKVDLTVQRSGASVNISVTADTVQPPAGPGGNHPNMVPRGPHAGMPFGMGGGDLQGVAPGDRFSHMIGGQFTHIDKDGNKITTHVSFGAVVSASDTSLTITVNGGSQQTTYQISSQTKSRGKVSDLKAGDNVVVITQNDSKQATAVMSMKAPAQRQGAQNKGGPNRGQGAQGQRFEGMMQGGWPSMMSELPMQFSFGSAQ